MVKKQIIYHTPKFTQEHFPSSAIGETLKRTGLPVAAEAGEVVNALCDDMYWKKELVFVGKESAGGVAREAGANLGAILTGFLAKGKVAAIEDAAVGEVATRG